MEWRLAEQIRSYRLEKGMTQEKLAEAVGVTVGAVSKWESGASVPELSALVELACLFGTSVDALIGYQAQDYALPVSLRRLRALRDARSFAEGEQEARRLLRNYPNSFEAVYYAANFYNCFGLVKSDSERLRSSIELYERSLTLIAQNTDEEIGEMSIRRSIADTRILLGEREEGVRELKRCNDSGVHDLIIGATLALTEQKDEAKRYLFRALLSLGADLVRLVFGYANAAVGREEMEQVLELLDSTTAFTVRLAQPGQISFLTKLETSLYAVSAHLYAVLGRKAEAEASLRRAWEAASRFDAAPNYSVTALRFYCGDPLPAAFDDFGETATQGVEKLLDENPDSAELLRPLWEEWKHEKA